MNSTTVPVHKKLINAVKSDAYECTNYNSWNVHTLNKLPEKGTKNVYLENDITSKNKYKTKIKKQNWKSNTMISSNKTLHQLLSIKCTFSSPQLQAKDKLQTCSKFLFICVAFANKLSLMNTSLYNLLLQYMILRNIFITN